LFLLFFCFFFVLFFLDIVFLSFSLFAFVQLSS